MHLPILVPVIIPHCHSKYSKTQSQKLHSSWYSLLKQARFNKLHAPRCPGLVWVRDCRTASPAPLERRPGGQNVPQQFRTQTEAEAHGSAICAEGCLKRYGFLLPRKIFLRRGGPSWDSFGLRPFGVGFGLVPLSQVLQSSWLPLFRTSSSLS